MLQEDTEIDGRTDRQTDREQRFFKTHLGSGGLGIVLPVISRIPLWIIVVVLGKTRSVWGSEEKGRWHSIV